MTRIRFSARLGARALVAAAALATAAVLVAAPARAQVLVDGHVHPGEWDGALTVARDGDASVAVLRDDNYLYVRLARGSGAMTGADLIIADAAGQARRYHVSSALGEAEGPINALPADRHDWRNRGWTANIVGTAYDAAGEMQVIRADVQEYQLALRLLPADALHIVAVFKRPERRVPAPQGTAGRWRLDDLPVLDLARLPRVRPSTP